MLHLGGWVFFVPSNEWFWCMGNYLRTAHIISSYVGQNCVINNLSTLHLTIAFLISYSIDYLLILVRELLMGFQGIAFLPFKLTSTPFCLEIVVEAKA